MAKEDVVNTAVEMGLGEYDELSKLTVVKIKEMIDRKIEEEDAGLELNVSVSIPSEAIEEVANQIVEPICNHIWHNVRVISSPSNYVCYRCSRCGKERELSE